MSLKSICSQESYKVHLPFFLKSCGPSHEHRQFREVGEVYNCKRECSYNSLI